MKIKQSEIDAAIAVEVMDMPYCDHDYVRIETGSGMVYAECHECGHMPQNEDEMKTFTPSTDLNHAFEALEKWCKRSIWNRAETRSFTTCRGSFWHSCELEKSEDDVCGYKEHESLAIAICLALLSAVRGEQVTLEDES